MPFYSFYFLVCIFQIFCKNILLLGGGNVKEHLILFEKVDLKESHLGSQILWDVLLKNHQTLMPN